MKASYLGKYCSISDKLSGVITMATIQGITAGLIYRIEIPHMGFGMGDIFLYIIALLAGIGFLLSNLCVLECIFKDNQLKVIEKVIAFVAFYPAVLGTVITVISAVKSYNLK
ncbi:TPA: hypothetical protein MO340_004297 [Salmonella enterica subsp. salamae serovar 35:g,m,s,t:-]|nr:hypothetical protein [Salmonella enterica subsp. salamae serovar 35:g,m,s,t:-]HCA3549767.1 hypothetical protein [Salmonella enterica subsp. salamae serovar 35:g,m,s,t:-]